MLRLGRVSAVGSGRLGDPLAAGARPDWRPTAPTLDELTCRGPTPGPPRLLTPTARAPPPPRWHDARVRTSSWSSAGAGVEDNGW